MKLKIMRLSVSLLLPVYLCFSDMNVSYAMDNEENKRKCIIPKTTEFHEATSIHDLEKISHLLHQNKSPDLPDFQDMHGWTPIHIVAEKNGIDVLNLLINGGQNLKDLLSIHNDGGDTPFHIAAYHGHYDILIRLIELYEEGKNLKGYNGFTPLHTATSEGHFKLVKFLREKGADLSLRDNDDHTILHLAQSKRAENISNERNNKYDTIIEYLAQTAPDLITMSAKTMGTPLHHAASHDLLDQLKLFLQQKSVLENIDIRDEGGNGATPLQRAILNYKPRAAQSLVENGANVTAWMWGSGTLLHYLSHFPLNFSFNSFQALLHKKNVDLNPRLYGRTPLHVAISSGRFDTAKYLIDQGADIHTRTQDNYGYTPLHLAVLKREAYDYHADIIQYLIDRGANPQERTWDYGGTIFHCAAALGSYNWEWLVRTSTGKKLDKKIFSQVDNSSKKPLDLVHYQEDSQLPKGKQMKGDEVITKNNWLVSLYFTTSKPIKYLPVDFGHAIIVFEGLDVSDDTPFKKHFNMIHLHPEKGPSITTHMTKEEFDTKCKDWPGRNYFKWQVPIDTVRRALNSAIWEKNKITWEKGGDGTKEKEGRIIHNCSTYVLSILEKCDIFISDKGHRYLGKYSSEDGIVEVLNKQYKSKS